MLLDPVRLVETMATFDDESTHLDAALAQSLVGGLEPGVVHLVEYDPAWPERFEVERSRILSALGQRARRIEHIGSTSVPGLVAKPIIDVVVELDDPEDDASYQSLLESAGFVLRVREPRHRMYRRRSATCTCTSTRLAAMRWRITSCCATGCVVTRTIAGSTLRLSVLSQVANGGTRTTTPRPRARSSNRSRHAHERRCNAAGNSRREAPRRLSRAWTGALAGERDEYRLRPELPRYSCGTMTSGCVGSSA